jgi:hypothetical protein
VAINSEADGCGALGWSVDALEDIQHLGIELQAFGSGR